MADEGSSASDYRTPRVASALLLIAIVVVIVFLDAVRTDFEVNPIVVLGMLGIAAGLLGVEVPGLLKR